MDSGPTHPEGSPYPAGITEGPVPPIRPVRPAQPRRRVRRLARLLVRLALLAIVGSVAAVALWRFAPPPLSGVMAQRWLEARLHGQPFRLDYQWTPRRDIAATLPLAVIAAEDQRFFRHDGWDGEAIRQALEEAKEGGRRRGASTISQQTAKNLFLWTGRSWLRKGLETWYTFWIELLWPKERILEVYLNLAEWDEGVFGVGAACRRHFDTTPARLDRARAARLAAVLPNPRRMDAGHPSAYVLRRQGQIQAQMGHLDGSEFTAPLRGW
ncbi:MAG: monofunctional biosynthetic peptidoglycan transglycosylase [bacterium]|nr:monofunctional biosynthetic peptidoglycan transglycosylase [bacterium]